MSESGLGYPAELAQAEQELIRARRAASEVAGAHPIVGLALSGGGVRSATFSLGVFQGLCRQHVLKTVDYLSTVSGGGYFGGCFSAIFARARIESKRAPQKAYDAWERVGQLLGPRSALVRFLRDNGNYLAPNGGADRALIAAVYLRNWLAVQLMVWSLALLGWAGLELLVRYWARFLAVSSYEPVCSNCQRVLDGVWLDGIWAAQGWLSHWTLSPWFLVAATLVAVGMFPLAWAYWTVGAATWTEPERPRDDSAPERAPSASDGLWELNVGALLVQVVVTTATAWTPADSTLRYFAIWSIAATFGSEIAGRAEPFAASGLKRRLQGWMMLALSVGTQLAVTWNLVTHAPKVKDLASTVGFSLLAGLFIFATNGILSSFAEGVAQRRMAASVGVQERAIDRDNYARHNLSVWFKTATALTLASVLVAVLHTTAQLLYAWLQHVETQLWAALVAAWGMIAPILQRFGLLSGERSGKPRGASALLAYVGGFLALLVPVLGAAVVVQFAGYPSGYPAFRAVRASNWTAELWLGVEPLKQLALGAGAVGLLIGASRYFLNNSSHVPLYSSRLIRTFLAGSRRASAGGQRQSPTYAMPGDDLPPDEFWHPEVITKAGAPLHLINVTVNETIDGRTQLQNKERKGTGMALGPCAVSLGVQHHVLNPWRGESKSCGAEGYRVFDYPKPGTSQLHAALFPTPTPPGLAPQACEFLGEKLTVGTWLAISGAAFSTALGWRTNLGLSLLAGLFNVRLGFWWRARAYRPRTLSRLLGPLFWVQQYYLRELFARFPGTANSLWYLTDGGHFENMGGYELIRRCCPLVIVVDAEADGAFEFEGLTELVRKARLDFSADIEFLTHSTAEGHLLLKNYLKPHALPLFGGLSQLARGTWQVATDLPLPPTSEGKPRYHLETPDERGLSLAHAALARIKYAGGKRGWLIYLKPTLVGGEPQDVRRYHVEHPTFPHEATIDQFFGEAQFESYRCLGEHIANSVFQGGLPLNESALGEVA